MASQWFSSLVAVLVGSTLPAQAVIAATPWFGGTPGLSTVGGPHAHLNPAFSSSAADGEWNVPPPSGRLSHTAIFDPVRDRMIVYGGYTDGSALLGEVWTLALADSAAWTQLFPTGTAPSPRFNHTAVYDSVRDRMVVFGGNDNQTWQLSLSGTPVWTNLAPAGTPPTGGKSSACTAIYDPVRDRILVFGGVGPNNDLWELTLSGGPVWTKLAPSGTLPAGRLDHTAIYDPVRDRMIVFGGYGGGARNDLWELSLSGGTPSWAPLTASGTSPGPRYAHTAIYDASNDRMIVYGGLNATSTNLNEVWALSLSGTPAWTQLAFSGSQPNARNAHTAIYDPERQRMVAYGGSASNGGVPYLSDVGAVSLSGSPVWTQVTPIWTPPAARAFASAVYDSVRARMIVFGGALNGIERNDVWTLSLVGMPAWSELVTSGTPPNPRQYQSMIYDSARDRLVVFGGWDGTNSIYREDVWALSLSGGPTWTQLIPQGTPPPPRGFHQAIYDPVGDRMVVFGGYDNTNYYNDTWVLNFAGTPTWTQVTPAGTVPSPRTGPAAVYDPSRHSMVVFGGYTGIGIPQSETWSLSLSGSPAWTPLSPAGTAPPGRFWHTAVYDPARDRLVVFAGFAEGTPANDAWALSFADGGSWTQLHPGGTPPSARVGQSAIYDAGGSRMVCFGGGNNVQYNDVRFLAFGGLTSIVLTGFQAVATSEGMELLWSTADESDHLGFHVWRRETTALPSDETRLTTDLITSRDSRYRFLDVTAKAGHTYEYRLADVSRTGTVTFHGPYAATMPDGAFPHRLWLGPAVPNPTRAQSNIRFALPEAGRASLRVFDIQGKLVRTIFDAILPAGFRDATWDGEDEAGNPAAAGVYYYRLDAGGMKETKRLLLMP